MKHLILIACLCTAGCSTQWGEGPRPPGSPSSSDGGDGDGDTLAPGGDDDDSATLPAAGPDEDGDGVPWPDDCWDGNPEVYPGATETCDGLDNDCSGTVDDAPDADGDGLGPCQGDCDDSDPSARPGLAEVCDDQVDNDCNTVVDDAEDADLDGALDCEDCDDSDPSVYPGAPGDGPTSPADGLDNDCDGTADPGAPSPGVAGLWWVATGIEVEVLSANPLVDINISDALAAATPPISDAFLLMVDPTTAITSAGFTASVGPAVTDGEAYGWSVPPAQVACPRLANAFTCGGVASLSLPLGPFESLVLHDAVFGGLLSAGDDLSVGSLDAWLAEGEIPSLATPNGPLAAVLGARPKDVDADGDGSLDGWSVAFTFLAL